jgi:hypothetical protein
MSRASAVAIGTEAEGVEMPATTARLLHDAGACRHARGRRQLGSAASDHARTMAAAALNISAGAIVD